MKKILLIIITLLCFENVRVYALNNTMEYYTNNNGVTFTQEEYDFLSDFYFLGYQNYMTQSDYNNFIESDIMNGTINSVLYDFSNPIGRTTNSLETQMKLLKMSSSCSTTCVIATTLIWKSNPSVRSYDHIGALLNNTSLIGGIDSKLYYGTNVIYPSYSSVSTNGVDSIFKLPNTASSIKVVNTFTIQRQGSVNVSYQHAKNSISLTNSKLFSYSSSGYGGVYNFDSSVRNYYDAMNGLQQRF